MVGVWEDRFCDMHLFLKFWLTVLSTSITVANFNMLEIVNNLYLTQYTNDSD